MDVERDDLVAAIRALEENSNRWRRCAEHLERAKNDALHRAQKAEAETEQVRAELAALKSRVGREAIEALDDVAARVAHEFGVPLPRRGFDDEGELESLDLE
jgi:hypothetical protein